MLDEPYGPAEAVDLNAAKFDNRNNGVNFEEGHLYCGRCGARRRMRTTIIFSAARDVHGGISRRWHMKDPDDAQAFLECTAGRSYIRPA
jgi:hypothetical protein